MASLDDVKNSLRADVSRLTAKINSLEDERTNLQITLEKIEEREKIVEDADRERRFEKAQTKAKVKETLVEVAEQPADEKNIYTDPAVADIAKQIEKHNAKHKGAV